MKMAVSDFGNLRSLSGKILAAHKASKGNWLYMRENLEGVDKLANVGLLLLGESFKSHEDTYDICLTICHSLLSTASITEWPRNKIMRKTGIHVP